MDPDIPLKNIRSVNYIKNINKAAVTGIPEENPWLQVIPQQNRGSKSVQIKTVVPIIIPNEPRYVEIYGRNLVQSKSIP